MDRCDLLVENCCVVTMDPERRILWGASVAADRGKIRALGSREELAGRYEAARVIDGTGKILFPGLINTHDHLFQMLVKGLGRDKDLIAWLDASVRPAICQIGPEEIGLAAQVGLMEQIASGVTTCVDYQYAHGQHGLDQAVMDAMDRMGIRGVLARGFTRTKNFPAHCRCPVNETEDDSITAAQALHARYADHPRLSVWMAPGIIWDYSEAAFRRMRAVAGETGMRITMHTAETTLDNQYCLEQRGKRVIPYLDSLGVLGEDFLAVHCVDMDETDLELFRQRGVKVSYNPLSNMIMGYDVTPIVEMNRRGIPVSLALDGPGSNDNQNMLEVLKSTALLQKTHHRDPQVMPAWQVLEMATLGGARAVGMEDEIGSIEVGKRADFFLFDPLHINSVPIADPVAALVYTGCEHNICLTAVEGKVIYEAGRWPGVDEGQTLLDLQRAGVRVRRKAGLGNTVWGQFLSMGEFQRGSEKRGD